MKTFLTIFVLFFSCSVVAETGDTYDCKIEIFKDVSASGMLDQSILDSFTMEWKSKSLLMDDTLSYEILYSDSELVVAKYDINIEIEPYTLPFAIVYFDVPSGSLSISNHSFLDKDIVISSLFASCSKKY